MANTKLGKDYFDAACVSWEDDHGRDGLLSWATLLLARIRACQRAVQCCLIK